MNHGIPENTIGKNREKESNQYVSNQKKYDPIPYYDPVQTPENIYNPSRQSNIYMIPVEMNPGASQLKEQINS